MKLLCLHGYTQSAAVFQKRIAVLQKALLQLGITSIFLDGPHRATSSFKEAPTDDEYSWWNTIEEPMTYAGYDESVEYITPMADQVDGILGFSQGATMALLLPGLKPKYVIAVGGFLPRDISLHEKLFKGRVLIVGGERDELVPLERTVELAEYLAGKRVKELNPDQLPRGEIVSVSEQVDLLVHDGSHYVPQKQEYRKMILGWIRALNKL
jgi:pimeloyl-ACP methyl ester carboxylesterase